MPTVSSDPIVVSSDVGEEVEALQQIQPYKEDE